MFYKNMSLIFFDFETTGINPSDFPIEIGMVFCDEHLLIKDLYSSYIAWTEMRDWDEWPDNYLNAYNIHKINLRVLKQQGELANECVKQIVEKVDKNCSNIDKMKPTLVSDNAYFDTVFMKKLFEYSDYNFNDYFHYTTWDINMLYVPTNTKKAKSHTHRALDDAANMYHRTLRALEKIKYFD